MGHSILSNNDKFKFSLGEYAENHVFWSLNSEILRLSFEDLFWGTLDTNAKNEPALGSSGGRDAR